ncbi:sigma-70 family RNA polymerase sigma factor [Acidovorax sp. SUPP1855]|uniref:sigma-70 family RNA polymerase sigma factor n=1 Tax=Acidovorax sp. SUPP1855 TaxID=431774 RepID=UPI0023DE299A|nr:sigma-70 family RNA polymerase sigma factor [Acidovorax sp. SUPP1855]GKS87307.1 sigma-70 family RNA polymerase sigma factor [Acidovorax sp. SUPP1855]
MAETARSASSIASPIPEPEDGETLLWQRWRHAADMEARDRLIQIFLPYARMLAAISFKGRFHDEVEFSDYFQLASIGLVEAVDRYDPEQGARFKTYAAHRIRGAILNGLEKLTEKNQQIALQKRLRKDRLDAAKSEASLSADFVLPYEGDAAARNPSNLLAYLAEVGIGLALGMMLEGTAMIAGEASEDACMAISPEVLYFRKSESQHWQSLLGDLVDRLPEQERRVIRCHYQQNIAFEDISHMMGVSRSRISQIHRQALLGLRKSLAEGAACDVTW